MGKSPASKLVKTSLDIADKIFGTSVDLALWSAVYIAELSIPDRAYGKIWRAQRNADEIIGSINYKTIKNGIRSAKRRGYISKSRKHAWPQITQAGKKRLTSLVP